MTDNDYELNDIKTLLARYHTCNNHILTFFSHSELQNFGTSKVSRDPHSIHSSKHRNHISSKKDCLTHCNSSKEDRGYLLDQIELSQPLYNNASNSPSTFPNPPSNTKSSLTPHLCMTAIRFSPIK